MTPEGFLLTLYGGMLRAGIPMREIDKTDLHRYLRVLAHECHSKDEDEPGSDATELRRGTVDMLW